MKNSKKQIKKLLVPILALMLLAGVTYGSGQALADDTDTTDFPPIVQRLVDKFNLDEGEVSDVLSDYQKERHDHMQQMMEDRLSQLVSDGTITEDQKQAILDEHAQMQAQHEEMMTNWDSMSEEEKLAAHDAQRDELQTWAEENGLDLREIFGGWGHHSHMMGFWK